MSLVLFLLAAACAPKAGPGPQAGLAPGPRPSAPTGPRPLNLWEVARDGKVSHVLGTCHVGVDLAAALPKPDDALLGRARVLYTEAPLDADPITIFRMVWSDRRLSERLPEDAFIRLVTSSELPASLVDHFPPWVAATAPLALTGDPTQSMDLELQRRAAAAGVASRHLETLEQQVALLARHDDAFLAALAGPPDAEADLAARRALDAYCLRGEVPDETLVVDPADPTTEPMLWARNRAWMETLRPELAEGGAFVAVGAAHLLGEQGLLRLLEGEGYTVRRHSTERPAQATVFAKEPPPAPPVDPAVLRALQDSEAPTLTASLCAGGSMVRSCFIEALEPCEARVAVDARLCAISVASGREPGPTTAAERETIGRCVVAGLAFDATVHDRFGPGTMCQMMREAMLSGTRTPR